MASLFQRSRWFLPVLLGILGFLPVATIAAAQGQNSIAATNTPLEQFKQFLASPPVIEDIVFQEKLPPNPGQVRPLDGSFSKSQFFNYYHARWQTNALLFRHIPGPEDATNHNVLLHLVAQHDNHFWLMELNTNIALWINPGGPLPTNGHSLLGKSRFRTRLLNEVLLFGLMHLELGKIQWKGNRFYAASGIKPCVVDGELFTNSAGYADHLRIRYKFQKQDYHWIARYKYDLESPLPPYLPAQISMYWTGGQGEVELGEYRIHRLRVRDEPMNRIAFDPEPFVTANRWKVVQYTSGRKKRYEPGKMLDRSIVYSIWLGANGAIFLLGLRMKNMENKK